MKKWKNGKSGKPLYWKNWKKERIWKIEKSGEVAKWKNGKVRKKETRKRGKVENENVESVENLNTEQEVENRENLAHFSIFHPENAFGMTPDL